MGLLFQVVLAGAPLLFIAALVMHPFVAKGSRFSRVQRAIAILAIAATVIPGVWLLASGSLRSEMRSEPVRILVVLLVPIGFALPSVFTRMSIRTISTAASALVLAAFCLISGFSIGLAYLPAAALLLLAGMVGLIPRRAA
jgi:hypothetical protein